MFTFPRSHILLQAPVDTKKCFFINLSCESVIYQASSLFPICEHIHIHKEKWMAVAKLHYVKTEAQKNVSSYFSNWD